MKRMICAFTIIASGILLSASACASETWKPYWSAGAKSLSSNGLATTKEVKIYSPDHQSLIEYHNLSMNLYVGGEKMRDLTNLIGSPYLIEIRWSDDSRAFFVNASDGGLIGTWSTYIYVLRRTSALEIPIGDLIKSNSLNSNCHVNTASVAWLHGHRDLLILQQVPDTSNCRNMGHATGYIVSIKSRTVVKHLSPREIHEHYAQYLGIESKSAVSAPD